MGPLKNIKILEFSGIGPGPYCGMLLADLGADVIRVSKKSNEGLENKLSIGGVGSKQSNTSSFRAEDTIEQRLKMLADMPSSGSESRG